MAARCGEWRFAPDTRATKKTKTKDFGGLPRIRFFSIVPHYSGVDAVATQAENGTENDHLRQNIIGQAYGAPQQDEQNDLNGVVLSVLSCLFRG